MKYKISAACGCHKGKIRSNNEDNFFFNGECLDAEHVGLNHLVSINKTIKHDLSMAVFDGMGGESFGEIASFVAAQEMQKAQRLFVNYFISPKKYLERLAQRLNNVVVEAAKELCTDRMGSTLVSLYFFRQHVYVCNLGDSRAYRLRSGEFLQISQDHAERRPRKSGSKAPLTQHLGIDPEEMLIEPYIAKDGLEPGDQYLLCSDGLTDMLTNFEIADIMLSAGSAEECVQFLIDTALERGGRDNITVIVGRIN